MLLGLIADAQGVALIPASLRTIAREGVVYRRLKEEPELKIEVAIAYAPQGTRVENTALGLLLDVLRTRYEEGWWAGWDSNPLSVDYESTAYTN